MVQLKKGISISDSLILTDGNIILDEQNLELLPGAGVQEGSRDSYVQTSGTGLFSQEIGPQWKPFPIGGSTFKPLGLSNVGTNDVYSARVTDSVLTQGSSGDKITREAIAATWFVEEAQAGGSDLDMRVQWYQANELPGFDPFNCFVSSFTNSWDLQNASAASSLGGANVSHFQNRANFTSGGIFAVFTEDVTPPQISCPSNIVQVNDQNTCDAVVTYVPPKGTDNRFEPTTVLSSGLGSGATFPFGTSTETYTTIDAAGNTSSCSFTITVFDNEAPRITCPADITVSNGLGNCDAVVSYSVPTGYRQL